MIPVMMRTISFLVFVSFCTYNPTFAQGTGFDDRISWQDLFDIVEIPSGPSREAKIAEFQFDRTSSNPNEWRRDLQQAINNRPYLWTESIVLVKNQHNIIRFITTFSVEFRRMVGLLTAPSSSTLGSQGVGAVRLEPKQVADGRTIERFRKNDCLIEILSYKDKSGLENWVSQITKGAF